MPSLNFTKQFAAAVENGDKTQTVRATRKRPFRPGDTLYLYTGMRTKQCRKLGESVCLLTQDIWIEEDALMLHGKMCGPGERDEFAFMDGFLDWDDFKDWFSITHGLPFEGQVIYW